MMDQARGLVLEEYIIGERYQQLRVVKKIKTRDPRVKPQKVVEPVADEVIKVTLAHV